jgi:hypothetical protein
MNHKLWLSIAILPWLLFLLAAVPSPRREETQVVYLSGKAKVQIGSQRRPVRLHDRLPADAVIEVEKSSRVAVTLDSGKYYLLHERSRVRLEKDGLAVLRGKVELLKPVKRLLPPVAPGARPGKGSAVLRVEMRGLESGPQRRSSFVAWDSPEFTAIPVAVQ